MIANNLDETLAIAHKVIMDNDRMLYSDLLRSIENYCSEHNFLIMNLSMLLGDPIDIDEFVYKIYISGGWETAQEVALNLLNIHAPHLSPNTIELTTVIKNEEFAISINLRKFVSIVNAQPNILTRIRTDTRGYFSDNVPVVSAIVHLCNTYQNLYNPAKYKQWKNELEIEDKLFNLFASNILDEYQLDINSQNQSQPNANRYGGNPLSIRIYNNIEKFNGTVVGDFAQNNRGRLQFISELPISEIAKIAKSIVKKQVIYSTSSFMFDFRLRKYTLKIDGKDIADVFNSTSYEVISDSLFVQLRFSLIQYYITNIAILRNDNSHNDNSRNDNSRNDNSRTKTQLLNYARLRADMRKVFNETPQILFPKSVMGSNISETVSRKKVNAGQIYSSFFPAVAAKYGSYSNSEKSGGRGAIMSAVVGSAVSWANEEPFLRIAQRITQNYSNDISKILKFFWNKNAKTKWASRVPRANRIAKMRAALSYVRRDANNKGIPDRANNITYIDIGTGDGEDFALIAQEIGAAIAIATDISDNRDKSFIEKTHKFAQININKPLEEIGVITLATFLHSLHHSIDAEFRLRDIAGRMNEGGIIIVKDHDVIDQNSANIVSFEHFVYSVGEGTANVDDSAEYQSIEPMYYYSVKQISDFIGSLGFTQLYLMEPRGYHRVYTAVFAKNKQEIIKRSDARVLYKGDFDIGAILI